MWRTAGTLCAAGLSSAGRRIDEAQQQRSVGYGPFSNTVKRRQRQGNESGACGGSQASTDVMEHVQLPSNHHLRTSLAGLLHPTDMRRVAYGTPEWRLQMVRLYRTILRLHNKTVAVSLDRSRSSGAEAAVSSVTGVGRGSPVSEERRFLNGNGGPSAAGPASSLCQGAEDPTHVEDYLLRYLLTEQQREFGNKFVQQEFARHQDADAVYAAIFYDSWYSYVLQLASGITAKDLSESEKKMLTEEQRDKLQELRGAFLSLRASNEPGYMP